MSPKRPTFNILRLALPMIVTNITVPLLGLVDVAIVGHIGNAIHIGAIAVGSMIFNVIYWVFGFLRMGTSGMTSQALGRRDLTDCTRQMARSAVVALSIAAAIIILQVPIRHVAFLIIRPDPEVVPLVTTYFNICVWGAPAMLSLYSLSGWLVGMQNTRLPMVISITQNIVNILVSLVLVFSLHWQIEGVATGTLIAQYAGALMAVVLIIRYYGRLHPYFQVQGLLRWMAMRRFFSVNTDIFLRTLCLVAVNLYFLAAGARQGTLILAVNTLLMQLFMLYSYIMDGFAYAGEALSGRYLGAQNFKALRTTVRQLFYWGAGVVVVFTTVYAVWGTPFLRLLTSDTAVIDASAEYFLWAVAVPVAGMAAFIWDGVFIGTTATRGMLISSAVATVVFFAVYLFFQTSLANHALWLAFILYLLTRGIVQTFLFRVAE